MGISVYPENFRFDPRCNLRSPRTIESTIAKATIESFFRKRSGALEDIIKSARAAQQVLPKPNGPKAALEHYLDFAVTCRVIATSTLGTSIGPGNPKICSRLELGYLELLVDSVKNDPELLDSILGEIKSILPRVSEADYPAGFYKVKIYEYWDMIKIKRGGVAFAETGVFDISDALEDMSKQLGISNLPGAIMKEIAQLRKFGIKTAFFQDGVTHVPEGVWLFMDPAAVADAAGNIPPAMAHAYVARKSEVMSKTQISIIDSAQTFGKYTRASKGPDVGVCLSVAIDREGEMRMTGGFNQMSLGKIFSDLRKEGVYRTLQMMQLMRLYDLVVPMSVVATMPELPRQPSLIGRLTGAKPKPFTPTLIIPRIKKLWEHRLLKSELQIEVETAEKETVARARREMREHEVVAHIRKLTKGYHASGKAVEEARQYGIHLAENETFVKTHKRGKGEHVGIHEVKDRFGFPTAE